MKISLAILSLLALAACGSTGGPSYLYEDGDAKTRLKNAEIRMETQRSIRGGPGPDVRLVTVKDNEIKATFESPARRLRGAATLPVKDYAELWEAFMQYAGWDAEIAQADPQGGYFHLIRYRLDTKVATTSAQDRSAFFGLATSDIRKRLKLSNRITEILARHIEPVKVAPAPAAEAPAQP